MAVDVASIRADTPGVDQVLHLNHAGASLAPRAVLDTMVSHLRREMEFGAMEAGAAAHSELEQVRTDAAALVGAETEEIAFTLSNSDSWGRAFAALRLKPGDRALVGRAEWSSNLANMRKAGLRIDVIPVDGSGQTDVDALGRMLNEEASLVSLTWAPANGGLIEPAAAVGGLARAAGVPFFLDATQAVGQLPVDVGLLGCDVLTSNARKYLRGPRGAAMLYLRRDFWPRLDPMLVDYLSASVEPGGVVLRSDARRLEIGECSPAVRLGFGTAIRLALDVGLTEIRAAIRARAEDLRTRLADLPGIELRDLGTEHSGIVSFTYEGWSGPSLRDALAPHAINIGFNGRSYTPLDMEARSLDEVLRASVSYFTTEDEVDRFVRVLAGLPTP